MTAVATARRSPGRPPKLSPAQQNQALKLLSHTDKSVKEVASILRCSPANIYNTVGSKQDCLNSLVARNSKKHPRRGKKRAH